MSNRIVHVEIAAKDPEASAKFYHELFGWKLEHAPEYNYWMFEAENGIGGGFPQIDGQNTNAGEVTVYISVDDIDAKLKEIEKLGGKTVLGKTEIPMTGWFALFTDPAGSRMALYTSMRHPEGEHPPGA